MSMSGIPTASNSSNTTSGQQQASAAPSTRSHQPLPNTPTGPSSSSSSRNKLEQIIQNFYTKTAQVIVQARQYPMAIATAASGRRRSSTSSTASGDRRSRLNRWFNLATSESLRDELKFWQTHAIANGEEPPPLILDIYLDVSRLSSSQVLVLAYDRSRRIDISDSTERILLERWTLSLSHPLPTFTVDLPNLYKRSIVFFRALYTYARLLPSHDLYRRLRQYGASDTLEMGYRMTAAPVVEDADKEIALDMSVLEGADSLQQYEFCSIVTPMGSFKLQVHYRKICDFCVEDSERDLSARMIGIDEHFFTPTMEQHRQDQRARYEESSRPASRQSAADDVDPREVIQRRQRRMSVGLRDSSGGSPFSREGLTMRTEPTTPTSTMLRRVSAPHIAPFKSQSLSCSPQAEIYLSGDRAQASSGGRSQHQGGSAPARTKVEFSSSFDKIRDRQSPTAPSTVARRWSRSSDRSSIQFDPEDASLEEFMRFAASKPELQMFQNREAEGASQMMGESANMSPTSETGSSMGSICRSKKTLSHFRALRETNTTLSESLSSSVMGRSSAAERGETAGFSFGSSTSSTGRSYLPVVPSPLHTENAATTTSTTTSKPVYIPPRSMSAVPGGRGSASEPSSSSSSRRRHSCRLGSNASSAPGGSPSEPRYPAFSTYPQDRRHNGMQRLYSARQQGEDCNCQHPSDHSLSSPKRPDSVNSIATAGHRASLADDDDSLVFRMSELSDGQPQPQPQPQAGRPPASMLEDETFGPLTEAATRDYARRLGIVTERVSLPRVSSSASIPLQSPMATVVEEEERSASAASSRSSSHHHHIF